MKKILAILLMLAALLASCDRKNPEIRNDVASYSIYVDTIRGHEYIILRGMYFGSIIHSASCPCKKGGEDNEYMFKASIGVVDYEMVKQVA